MERDHPLLRYPGKGLGPKRAERTVIHGNGYMIYGDMGILMTINHGEMKWIYDDICYMGIFS